jgi:hypothetical protein
MKVLLAGASGALGVPIARGAVCGYVRCRYRHAGVARQGSPRTQLAAGVSYLPRRHCRHGLDRSAVCRPLGPFRALPGQFARE